MLYVSFIFKFRILCQSPTKKGSSLLSGRIITIIIDALRIVNTKYTYLYSYKRLFYNKELLELSTFFRK